MGPHHSSSRSKIIWHVSVTEQLIETRCNIDLQDENGCTLLYVTVYDSEGICPSWSDWLKLTVTMIFFRRRMDGLRSTWYTTVVVYHSTNRNTSVTENLRILKLTVTTCMMIFTEKKDGCKSLHVMVHWGRGLISKWVTSRSQRRVFEGKQMLVTEWQRKNSGRWMRTWMYPQKLPGRDINRIQRWGLNGWEEWQTDFKSCGLSQISVFVMGTEDCKTCTKGDGGYVYPTK